MINLTKNQVADRDGKSYGLYRYIHAIFFLGCANLWLYSCKLAKNKVLGCAKDYFKNLAIFYAFFHVWLQLDQKAFA